MWTSERLASTPIAARWRCDGQNPVSGSDDAVVGVAEVAMLGGPASLAASPPEPQVEPTMVVLRAAPVDPERVRRLVTAGYRPVAEIGESGEVSRRGGIVDVYGPGMPHPVRLEFDALSARVLQGGTDEEILEWCFAHGRRLTPEQLLIYNSFMSKRGWRDVKKGEVCKIPGVGPVSPQTARAIAADAFLTGVFYDGKDLRQMRRWTRNTPVEVRLALELGDPPDFDGVRCTDCGNRFRTEFDHVEPHCARGPASVDNFEPRCWACHRDKTERDRKAGKLTPPDY